MHANCVYVNMHYFISVVGSTDMEIFARGKKNRVMTTLGKGNYESGRADIPFSAPRKKYENESAHLYFSSRVKEESF